jgi:hypothetical protein
MATAAMNIDERLERLTARHEALTRSLEMLAQDIRDLAKAQVELVQAQSATEQRMGQVLDLYTRLGNIVIGHEDRISRLEEETGL